MSGKWLGSMGWGGRARWVSLAALVGAAVSVAAAAAPASAITKCPCFGYQSQFGTEGSSDGQFREPWGVAVDPNTGDVYVSDLENSRVEKFDSHGAYISQFGSPGAGNGQFKFLVSQAGFGPNLLRGGGVAVDPSGDVYVSDPGNGRVQKFDPDGNYLSEINAVGRDVGIAVDPTTGDVYVAIELPFWENDNSKVEKFDSNGNKLADFGENFKLQPFDEVPQRLRDPLFVAVDPSNGDVYVSDYGNEWVDVFDSSGDYLRTIGNRGFPVGVPPFFGGKNGEFVSPAGVAFDPNSGDFYVADEGNRRVQKFDPDGNYISKFGKAPAGQGGKFFPIDPFGVAVDAHSGDVYVVEPGLATVLKYGVSLLQPTSTAISCSPVSITVGQPASCTVTVTDLSTAGAASPPTGIVSLRVGQNGQLAGNPCRLVGDTRGLAASGCTFVYTSTAAAKRPQAITTRYRGDARHAASRGKTKIMVAIHQ